MREKYPEESKCLSCATGSDREPSLPGDGTPCSRNKSAVSAFESETFTADHRIYNTNNIR
jgi:hypothetical protein